MTLTLTFDLQPGSPVTRDMSNIAFIRNAGFNYSTQSIVNWCSRHR